MDTTINMKKLYQFASDRLKSKHPERRAEAQIGNAVMLFNVRGFSRLRKKS